MEYQNIWTKILGDDENVEYEFSLGKRYRMFYLILFVIVGLLLYPGLPTFGVIFMLCAFFYFGFYLKAANAYAFTNKRVLVHTGWLSTQAISIEYEKITDVTVQEPLIERLIAQTGNLSINTAGTASKEVVLKHIATPYEVRKKLERIRTNK